jgi:hypothetical protein
MLIHKNIMSLSTLFVLSLITTTNNAFHSHKSIEREYLTVYDLCIAFEHAFNNMSFHGSVSFNDIDGWGTAVSPKQVHQAVELIKKIKAIKQDKQLLLLRSEEELQEIKTELITALQEIELLKKPLFDRYMVLSAQRNESIYKKWVKVVFKLFINGIGLGYLSENNPLRIPLLLIQIYYLFGFGKATFNVLNDLADKALQKI